MTKKSPFKFSLNVCLDCCHIQNLNFRLPTPNSRLIKLNLPVFTTDFNHVQAQASHHVRFFFLCWYLCCIDFTHYLYNNTNTHTQKFIIFFSVTFQPWASSVLLITSFVPRFPHLYSFSLVSLQWWVGMSIVMRQILTWYEKIMILLFWLFS